MPEEDEEEESDMEDDEEREELEEEKGTFHVRRMGDMVMAGEGDGFSLENRVEGVILTEEVRVEDGNCRVSFAEKEENTGKEMYMARGLGIDGCGNGMGGCRGGGCGGGGGGDYNSMGSGGDNGDSQGVEEYYKRMVEENPGNPLFLRNYAQYLYQVSFKFFFLRRTLTLNCCTIVYKLSIVLVITRVLPKLEKYSRHFHIV